MTQIIIQVGSSVSVYHINKGQAREIEKIVTAGRSIECFEIYKSVCKYANVTGLGTAERGHRLAYFRSLFVHLCKLLTSANNKEIGDFVKFKDHSGAIKAFNSFQNRYQTEPKVKQDVEKIMALLKLQNHSKNKSEQ